MYLFQQNVFFERYTILMVLIADAIIYRGYAPIFLDQKADRFSSKYKYSRTLDCEHNPF
jgi:O-methyltransferase involved in polyketide biosynthesis